MRVMEDQQKRHTKEVYVDSALRSLSSELSNDSVFLIFHLKVHTHKIHTHTERINAMITDSVKAKKELLKLSITIYLVMIWGPQLN